MFTVNVSQIKGVQLFEILGRIDGDTAPEVGQTIDKVLDQGQMNVVLDLSGVEYMSSPGLREIVRIYKRAVTNGGDLRIANPSERVLAVLQLAGLDRMLKIFNTSIEAVNSF
jgi:anti-sigma B factor antagonist